MANSCVSFLDTGPKWRVPAYSQANTDLNSKFFYCPKPLKRTLKTRRGWVVGGGNGLIRATLFSFVHTMHRIALATTRKPYRILSFHRPANPVFWLATQQARCGHIGTFIFSRNLIPRALPPPPTSKAREKRPGDEVEFSRYLTRYLTKLGRSKLFAVYQTHLRQHRLSWTVSWKHLA